MIRCLVGLSSGSFVSSLGRLITKQGPHANSTGAPARSELIGH